MELLWEASKQGIVDEVRRLTPISHCANWNSHPLYNNSQAFQSAVIHKNQEIVDLLYPLSDPDAALKHLLNTFKHTLRPSPYQDFIDRVEEGRFRRQLNKEIETQQPTAPSKSKRKM